MEINHREQIIRPWGSFIVLKKDEQYWVKKLYIRPKARLSLQSHRHRNEIWFILHGEAYVQIGEKESMGWSGDVFYIPQNCQHRITAITFTSILEVAYGKVSEQDITRYEDDYGRTTSEPAPA